MTCAATQRSALDSASRPDVGRRGECIPREQAPSAEGCGRPLPGAGARQRGAARHRQPAALIRPVGCRDSTPRAVPSRREASPRPFSERLDDGVSIAAGRTRLLLVPLTHLTASGDLQTSEAGERPCRIDYYEAMRRPDLALWPNRRRDGCRCWRRLRRCQRSARHAPASSARSMLVLSSSASWEKWRVALK